MKINPNVFARKKLLALAVPMLMFGQAQAAQFDFGEVGLTVDTQLSLGSSWRMEKQNDNLLDYEGTGVSDGNTSNDGNLNYDKGDAVSQIFKGNHDIQITYQNFGAFVRGKYWYDSVIENNSVNHGHGPTSTRLGPAFNYQLIDTTTGNNKKLDDSDFNDLSKGSGAAIFDAFVYGSFDIGEMPLDVRVGKQVVSWGESTFIQGGVNAINPYDVAALRRPGAALKEGLIPVGMVYANLGLTESLSVEAFYQYEFQENLPDGCGTFFSTSDLASEGCDDQTFSIGAGAAAYGTMVRDVDGFRKPSDDGQFGVAARYWADGLNAEFGFYAMNIHSRSPLYGTKWSPTFLPQNMSFFLEYPEDIKLVGVSVAANAFGMAMTGEITHKMDAPIQINGTAIAQATLASGSPSAADAPHTAEKVAAYQTIFGRRDATTGVITGYDQYDITQIQGSLTHLENRLLGSSRMAFILEAGFTFVHDLDDELFYQKSSIYQAPRWDGSKYDDGFVTETSFGYRALVSASYNNAFAGLDLNPIISFAHDVDGYGPAQGAGFSEGNKKLGLSLKANYLQRYDASISYTMFMGGDFNPSKDRDFLAISAGVQF